MEPSTNYGISKLYTEFYNNNGNIIELFKNFVENEKQEMAFINYFSVPKFEVYKQLQYFLYYLKNSF